MATNSRNSVPCTVGLPDKGRAIKGLVVCTNWDLETLDLLNGLTLGWYQPSSEVLKNRIMRLLFVVILPPAAVLLNA